MERDGWKLIYDRYTPESQGVRETLCTLGNGYFATRGAFSEVAANDTHYPGTYVAGGYNRLGTEVSGVVIENEDLVNMPNWLPLKYRVNGETWCCIDSLEILEFQQVLNLEKATLSRRQVLRDNSGRESLLEEERLVHIKKQHLAAIRWQLTSRNWSGHLEVRASIDGTVENSGVPRYRKLHSQHLIPEYADHPSPDLQLLQVHTSQSHLQVAVGARLKGWHNGDKLEPQPLPTQDEIALTEAMVETKVSKGDVVEVEKIVSLYTSRDRAISECGHAAEKTLRRAPRFKSLLRSHSQVWSTLWAQMDIHLDCAACELPYHPALILRLHLLHLIQTVSNNTTDLDVGVPARGWHGEAYRGHIFWDELFILPTLNLHLPKITQALLRYRYRRIEEACAAAAKEGVEGAMYPWQSGSCGREETQKVHLNPKSGRWIPDRSHVQRHVNAAIAYNIWQYYQVTGDIDFLYTEGAEMLIQIARFWASLAIYNEGTERYEIHGVMGPDEFHDGYPGREEGGLRNNAYTNVMAVWVISRALELFEIMPSDYCQDLCKRLEIDDEEKQNWRDVSRKMYVPYHGDGIISQFDGYDQLQEFDWDTYRLKYNDIQRLDRILEAEGDTPNRYKVSKQADLLMLFYLFSLEELQQLFEQMGYQINAQDVRRNIDYYLKRTSHGSTLSRIVHSWVLAHEDRATSWGLFLQALQSDISDIQGGTTAEGIHLGAMAGTVDLVQRCYAGIRAHDNVLWFDPKLPPPLRFLKLRLHYRFQSLEVEVTSEALHVRALDSSANPISIGFDGVIHTMQSGEERSFAITAE